MKGGVGKTSLSCALAAELAKAGDTLLIDADPQASASGWLAPSGINAELADALFEKKSVSETAAKTKTPGLYILPSFGLDGELNIFAETRAAREHNCMKKIIRAAAAEGFRFCVIDTHPDFGPLERAALIAADEVVVPLMPDAFAAAGLEIFSANLKKLRADEETDKPYFRRIALNGIDGRIKLHGANAAKMKAASGGVFTFYEIPVDPVFRAAQDAGKTVQEQGGAKKETLEGIRRMAADTQTS
jgi:chromosome partitioning protein